MSTEENRLSARAARYLRVGGNVGTIAAKVAGQRLFGIEADKSKDAIELARALGGLKGPIMKVAQLLRDHLFDIRIRINIEIDCQYAGNLLRSE